MNDMKNEVMKFIDRFTYGEKQASVEECFTHGCCFWFAHTLVSRFQQGMLVYDQVMNHFGCLIGDRVYDITGDVTDAYFWEPWVSTCLHDPALAKRIEHDCIYF